MAKFIKLDKRHMNQLAEIDYEAAHEVGRMRNRKLPSYKKEITRRFKEGYEIFFGCKENSVLKGYVSLKPFFPGHNHCELYWLSVRNKYQNQGIGTKLVNFIEKYAKKRGFRKICLYTNKIMKKTRKFYEKRGYKKVNEFPGYYGYKNNKNTTAVLYAKEI